MKLLVDTHIFLWAITGDGRLSARHRALYEAGDNELFLSVASIWEMLIKAGLGRLPLPQPAAPFVYKQLEQNRISVLALRQAQFAALEDLPPLHRDPFDRLLIAQARAEKMPVLSADPKLRAYPVKLL